MTKLKLILLKYITIPLILFMGIVITPFYYMAIGLRKLYEITNKKIKSLKQHYRYLKM